MIIRNANMGDREHLMTLINNCVTHMINNHITQWDEHYPNEEIMTQDIEKGQLHIIVDDESYYGMITLNEEQDPEYTTINWKYGGKALVIHRFAVNPNNQGQGIGKKVMAFVEEYACVNGYETIRFDTYSGNAKAVSFYRGLGYKTVGQVFFPYRDLPFYCYEKKLTNVDKIGVR